MTKQMQVRTLYTVVVTLTCQPKATDNNGAWLGKPSIYPNGEVDAGELRGKRADNRIQPLEPRPKT